PFLSTVYVRGFSAAPQPKPLWNEVLVPNMSAYSTISMDGQDNFVVAGEMLGDTDVDLFLNTAGNAQSNLISEGVYAAEYQLESYATGKPLAAPVVLRNTFRLNSSSTNVASKTVWPFDQTAVDGQMDLDGDIAATYQGNGPAVSTNEVDIPASFFKSLIPNNPNLPNGDLLPFFDPYTHKDPATGLTVPGDFIGIDSPQFGLTSSTLLYEANGSMLNSNFNVDSSIDQVLFDAEYVDTPAATPEQAGRLRAILENVAGLLRGESNGVLMSQWDSNPPNVQNPTYSDNVVNTQRDGQDQRDYITIPSDVQQGTFQLLITVGPSTTDPADVPGFQVITAPIVMPPTAPAEPGGPINDVETADDIALAINAVLGSVWPQEAIPLDGAVQVREVDPAEITARNGTAWQVPTAVTAAETPTVTVPAGSLAPGGLPFVFELIFQGQAHDIPVTFTILNPNDQQWIGTPVVNNNATTYTWALGGASPPVANLGDYMGVQGSAQYDAALSMNSAGNMVATYTDQALQTDGTAPVDANGNAIDSNIYYERLAESTDTAGPRITAWTSANGVDLLNAPGAIATNVNAQGIYGQYITSGTATNVNAQYLVLMFDEPMLAGDPTVDPDSVYNLANYQLYNGATNTLISGVITHIDYGLSEVAQMAGPYGNGMNPVPDNKWEAILTVNNGATPLAPGTYTLKVLNAVPSSSTTAGQNGLRNVYGTPLNLAGYDPTG
ncbi:MAG: hypothetical protein ABSH20_30760, partial [Tepidisphaeraceae bacterium]